MNKKAPSPAKIDDDPLWREVCDLAEYMYGKLPEFPEEEKWASAAKLRYACVDFIFCQDADPEAMISATENLTDWQTNPTFRQIFENDMQGLKDAEALVLVFPSGLAAHMELGAAYGMGKKCYGIGQPEKTETLYLMFDKIFPSAEHLIKELT